MGAATAFAWHSAVVRDSSSRGSSPPSLLRPVCHGGGWQTADQRKRHTAPIAPTLYPGYNRVCITFDGGAQGNVESDKCIEVAYLP
jgi:hypothetical protein